MLNNIIESLIFAAGKGISQEEIKEKFSDQYSEDEINHAIDELKNQYSGSRGIILIEYNNKLEFQSNPEYGNTLADILTPIKERELSKSLLESLAIIAYKQPVTRLDIEDIRGVNSDYSISMLLKFNLISIVGRKNTLGKPLLYATTDEFLKKFQLKSLEELPDYDELLDMIRNNFEKYYKHSESLYRGETSAEKDEVAASNISDIKDTIEDEDLPEFLLDEDIVEIE
ncbi:MAG: SMC-Scp complex subunit ScpB [Bacillota bacterium]